MSSSLLDWLVQNEPSFRKSRLPSLYSDLSQQRTTNPDGYTVNIQAWQAALTQAATCNELPTSSPFILHPTDGLLNALSSPQYGRPLGLGCVFDESVRSGTMIPTKEFLSSDQSIYHKSWVPSPWTVLQWGLRQIGPAGTGTYEGTAGARKLKTTSFVVVEALEKLTVQVLAQRQKAGHGLTDRICSRENFNQDLIRLHGSKISEEDATVLLRFLSRDKHALSYDAKTVKFSAPSNLPEPITQQDSTIASLRSLITTLTAETERLSTLIDSQQTKAASSVKAGNKVSALAALRSKKLAEKNLQARSDTLHQLETVFSRIEQAADQVQIVQAMENSADVLESLNTKTGGVENVENVVERLQEKMSRVDEVGKVLEEPLTPAQAVDQTEIDDEFEAMEAEQRQEQEAKDAEATRTKLAEIGESKQKDPSTETEQAIKRLSQMSIEHDDRNQVSSEKRPNQVMEE